MGRNQRARRSLGLKYGFKSDPGAARYAHAWPLAPSPKTIETRAQFGVGFKSDNVSFLFVDHARNGGLPPIG